MSAQDEQREKAQPGPTPVKGRVYLAAEGYEEQLRAELGKARPLGGRLYLKRGAAPDAAWAQNTWLEPFELEIDSIGQAARALKSIQRNWALHSIGHHRRASLIQEKLPHVSAKPLVFPAPAPTAPLGSWTLVQPGRVLASARCTSAFPNGEVRFVEDKSGPPNRAYLKLWEALTLLGEHPRPGERCVELGSAPGGWTWVLQGLGARVLSVDKAPLDPKIGALPEIEHLLESGFNLDPAGIGNVDWLLSDMACYPERLLALVRRWIQESTCRRIICTLKFQSGTDYAVANEFAAIYGGRLVHLFHNKHELTFLWRR